MKKRIIILGGGLSGLVAGDILSKNFEVNIFEKERFLGGLAANFEYKGRQIPMYYHHIIKSNIYTQKYLHKFCKKAKLKWKKIKVAIGTNKKISTINTLSGLIKMDYLTLYEKIRFSLFGLYTIFLMNPNKIKEGLNAEIWLNKYVGKSVTKKIFFHLYAKNKFNIPLSRISAKQFANRLNEREVQDDFTYPKESYQGMIDGFKKTIQKNKGIVKTRSKISEINLKEKFIVESGKKIKYDIIINAMPFEELLKVAKDLPKELKDKISKIKYCPAVGLCFGTEDFLKKGVYWINIFNERTHVIIQHSDLSDTYPEKINWCLRYGGSEEDLNKSDEEIKKLYLKDVKKYFPKEKIKWAKVFRTKYGEPIYDIDYHKYNPGVKTSVKGLYFTGIQITHPKIRNMNVALESGIKTARIVLMENMK